VYISVEAISERIKEFSLSAIIYYLLTYFSFLLQNRYNDTDEDSLSKDRLFGKYMTRTLIITGLAGAGKSTVVRILEDLGYFCIDNFLPGLVNPLLQLTLRTPLGETPVALIIDSRGDRFSNNRMPQTGEPLADDVRQAIHKFKDHGYEPYVLFLDCNTETLVRRYALSRRPHPYPVHEGMERAIEEERKVLEPLRTLAHQIWDTSDWTPQRLRAEVEQIVSGKEHQPILGVNLMSFGYKHGLPRDANLAFDIRFLANPYYDPFLRPLTGREQAVQDFVFSHPQTQETYARLLSLITYFLSAYEQEKRGRVTVAVGCTGGQHRSVSFVERLAEDLRLQTEHVLSVYHRDCDHNQATLIGS
jgi:RNase adapter protein RapZ